ncbi:MAG: sodium/solute symporter [Planctomycetales bacterium]|nr:sodium/solute symporter [Planctomycetales bacterium]MCA9166266.1 sodium/solute symporter [Planctomycetales bacterium]
MELQSIDLFFVILYLTGIALFGVWIGRGVKSGYDLFLAGRSLPWWAVGASLVVSDIGAKDMVGLADEGYRHGLVMANYDLIGCIFPVLIAAFVFMPFLWLAGVYTIPEYLGRRYNFAVRFCFAVVWAVVMVGMLGVIFVSAASMFKELLGWSFTTSVLTTAVVVGLYTISGGLKAVVFTDLVSCIVLIIGMVLICMIGLDKVGGWEALRTQVGALPDTEHHFELVRSASDPDNPWTAMLLGLGFVLGPAYWIGNQAIVQRTFGTVSQAEARASYVLCAAIKIVFPFLLVIPGLIGLALFHDKFGGVRSDNWTGGLVLPELVKLLPPGILGIVIGAFLAGVMSNLDSYVNSATTLCVTDLYKPIFRQGASDYEMLWVGRLLIVIFLAGGAIASYEIQQRFTTVFTAFQTLLSLYQGALLSVLLLGMLSRRVTQWGGFAGLIVGVTSASLMHYQGVHMLWVAWWSFVAAVCANVGVSMLTKPHDDERLQGLVIGMQSVAKESV